MEIFTFSEDEYSVQHFICRVGGYHSGGYEDLYLLG
jgi:hypothetical protein